MLEGIFEINSFEIDDLLSYMGKASSDLEQTNGNAKKAFEPNKEAEVFGKGAQKINDQMDEIKNNVEHLENVMKKGTSAIFDTEIKILEEAKSLEIPTGFEINDVVTDKATKEINLFKLDGLSVNEGTAQSELNVNISSVINKENLTNITKDETQEQNFDENELRVRDTLLRDITSKETEKQELDENEFRVRDTTLRDITNKETEKQEFDEQSLNVDDVLLKDISNNETKEVLFDDNLYSNNKVTLQNINTGNVTPINDEIEINGKKTELRGMGE